MKTKTIIMWNHLDYETQQRVMQLVSNLAKAQKDPLMKTALGAALTELEIWSNSPCEILTNNIPFEEPLNNESDDDDEDNIEPITKTWIH